ncbi:MAG: aminoacyl-tRNA hydrolase [Candidatus Marinimicrobia bacterium]|nr:aminoacyl-tRNA hydrolase [Candidatus Neomarinimicrobiota bacterium]|tara:strand:- start:68727 stop:69275 length:549 start_codon:yes stop_codon:yes gene_type:complete
MKIIVGLGNPGDNYRLTKHNFGFRVVDKLVKQRSLKYKLGKGDFVFVKDQDCMFVKPTTFMNNSGIAIRQILNYYDNVNIKNLIIIYDDVDLDLGQIRFKTQGSDGGHNGIKSIIYHLKSNKFDRLKIGIATSLKMRPSENYVLKPFPKKYNKLVEEVITKASSAIDYYVNNDIVKTMNNFN